MRYIDRTGCKKLADSGQDTDIKRLGALSRAATRNAEGATMAQVDFYEVEIKYSGNITDYTVDELYNMAQAEQERQGNYEPSYTKTMTRREAKHYDGVRSILTYFPCNHIAIVQYSHIREEVEA